MNWSDEVKFFFWAICLDIVSCYNGWDTLIRHFYVFPAKRPAFTQFQRKSSNVFTNDQHLGPLKTYQLHIRFLNIYHIFHYPSPPLHLIQVKKLLSSKLRCWQTPTKKGLIFKYFLNCNISFSFICWNISLLSPSDMKGEPVHICITNEDLRKVSVSCSQIIESPHTKFRHCQMLHLL